MPPFKSKSGDADFDRVFNGEEGMRQQLLDELMQISEEESKYKAGQAAIEEQLYSEASIQEIDRQKLLRRGKLITVRRHSRFVEFPLHRHNYVEFMYVVQGEIHQVTKDHSLVQEMVRMGEIKPEEARNHPDKNIITRALGAERTVDIDFFDLKLEPDSTILMCSDGLSNMVEDSEIEKIILNQTEELPQKGERLLREANQNGGKDNIAVILVEPFTNEVEKC